MTGAGDSNDDVALRAGSRKRRVVLLIVIALLVLPLAVLGCFVWRSHARFEAVLAEAHELGLATNLEELEAMRPAVVPDDQNAALVYVKAFDAFTDTKEVLEEGKVPIVSIAEAPDEPREPFGEEMLAASREFLERQSPALKLLSEASHLPESSYPSKITDSPYMPHLKQVREAARLLAVAAWTEAESSNGDAAVERIREGLAVAGSLDGEPLLTSRLTASVCRGVAVEGLTRVLARSHPSDGALAALQADLRQSAERLTFDGIVEGDFALLCDLYTGGTAGLAEDAEGLYGLIKRWWLRRMLRQYLVNSMPGYRAALEAVENPTPADLSLNAPSRFAPFDLTKVFFLATVDPLRSGQVGVERARAKLLAAEAAVAALRYYNANARLPESLDELVPEYLQTIPIDPFTGRALLFLQTDDGVMIYSVGGNGVDDGGYPYLITPPEGTDMRNWKREYDDTGFRLVLPGVTNDLSPRTPVGRDD